MIKFILKTVKPIFIRTRNLRLVFNVIMIGGLIFTWTYFNGRTMKVVYVDNVVIMSKYERMKDVRLEIEKKAEIWQANADSLINIWQASLKAYEKERTSMTTKERELREQLLTNQQQQINQYQEALQFKAKEEEQNMTQTVINEINDYLKEYGERHHYTYILGATSMGNLVYARENKNITDDILKGLNDRYLKKRK